jgi:hypothetical protein
MVANVYEPLECGGIRVVANEKNSMALVVWQPKLLIRFSAPL